MKKSLGLTLILIAILLHQQTVFIQVQAIPTGYSTKSQMLQKFASLETAYDPLVDSEVVGYTVRGEAITMWKIGNLSSPKIIMIDASRHGGEYVTTESLYLAIKWVLTSNDSYAMEIRKYQLLVIPIVNLDNYQKSRYNLNGVDLNRNFEFRWYSFTNPYKGSSPCSEPETKGVESVFTRYKIYWYLTLHAGDYRLTPAYWKGMSHPTTFYKTIYDRISTITRKFGVEPIPLNLYIGFEGTSTNDAYYSHGIYSFTVELTYSFTPSYSTVVKYLAPKIQGVISGIVDAYLRQTSII